MNILIRHRYASVPDQTLMPRSCQCNQRIAKANDGANLAAYKELLQVVKYVLNTEMLGLKIEPTGNSNEPQEIVCFSDSNYAGDLVSR